MDALRNTAQPGSQHHPNEHGGIGARPAELERRLVVAEHVAMAFKRTPGLRLTAPEAARLVGCEEHVARAARGFTGWTPGAAYSASGITGGMPGDGCGRDRCANCRLPI